MKSTTIKGIALSALCLITLESYGSYVAKFAQHNRTASNYASMIRSQQRAPYATQQSPKRNYTLYKLHETLTKQLPATPDAYVRGFAATERQLLLAKYLVDQNRAYRNPKHFDLRFNITEYTSGLAYESDPNAKIFKPLFDEWFNLKIPVAIKIPYTNHAIHTANYCLNDYKLDGYSRMALEYLLLLQAINNNDKILKTMLAEKILIMADADEQKLLMKLGEQTGSTLKGELRHWWQSCARLFKTPTGQGATALAQIPSTVLRGVIQYVRDTYKNQELQELSQELHDIVENTPAPQPEEPQPYREDTVSTSSLD